MRKRTMIAATVALAAGLVALTGCSSQADRASYDLSKEADSFQISRQIVFHDDITDTNIAKVDGRCSLGNDDSAGERTVTCKIGPDKFVKEIFQMGKNTSVSSIQTEPSTVDPYHYDVIFAPESVVPHIEVQTSH